MKKAKKDGIKLPKNLKIKLPKRFPFKPIKEFINKNKIFSIGIVVILVSFVLGFLLKGTLISATVNGKPISRFAVIKQLESRQGVTVLDGLITEELIRQEATKKGVKIDNNEIDDEIIIIEESLATQSQTLDQVLELQGMTRKQLVEQIKLQKMIERLLEDQVTVGEEEITAYIEANPDTFPEDSNTEEVRGVVREQLKQQKLGSTFQAWFEEVKAKAKINYFTKY